VQEPEEEKEEEVIFHDVRCTHCGRVTVDVGVCGGDYGRCDSCGGPRTWVPAKLNTDVYGSAQYSDASGEYHSSTHEKEMAMAKEGFYPAGDKVGGARPDHRIKGTACVYPGQTSHVSTGERSAGQ
jgi:hypothetical protein